MNIIRKCNYCDGTGEKTCTYCNGMQFDIDSRIMLGFPIPCTKCNGTGKEHCPSCHGTGKIISNK